MKSHKELESLFEEINNEAFILQNNKQVKKKNLLLDFDNEDFDSTINSKLHLAEMKLHNKELSNNTFFTSSDINSFDRDRLDKLLLIPSEESYVVSEGLLMDDDIEFLSGPPSIRISGTYSSAFNTTLNYTKTETMSSVFDSFYAPNAFRFSANHSQNFSKCFTGKSFDTQDPENVFERLDLHYYSSTERFTKRQQMIEEKMTKVYSEKTDDVSSRVPSDRLESQKPEPKNGNEDTPCCRGCLIS